MSALNLMIYEDSRSRQREQKPIKSLFEGFINKTLIEEHIVPSVQIKHRGIIYRINIVSTQKEFEQIKKITEENLGNHQKKIFQELMNINRAGKVLSLENVAGRIVATVQILTSPIPEHSRLAQDEAYCYGITVKPDEEGKGYTQVLFKAQEVIAREAGKQRITLVVNVKNVLTIRAGLHAGFRIVGYNHARYGPIEDDEGLLLEKKLVAESLPFDALKQAERVKTKETSILSLSDQEAILSTQPLEIAVPGSLNDEVDVTAHQLIEKVISAGYVGTGLLESAEYDRESLKQSVFIFQRKESLPFAETVSPPIHIYSEFGKLREIIASYSPEAAMVKPEYATNTIARSNIGNIDAIAFKEEHEGLLEVLRSQGVNIIHTSSFAPDGRTAIFTRDPAFVLGEMFVIGKSAKESRRYETEGMRRLSQGIKTVEIGRDGDAFIEGGDIIFIGNKTIAVGLGERTNERGLQRLAETFLDYTFIGVRHTDLHLDVLFTITGPKKALADVTRLPPQFLTFVQEVAGYEIIVADPQEQITLGCNVLAIDNNKVIAVAENRITNQRLRANGVEVIEVSMPNVIKKGGGPRCLTCPTRRD